MKLPDVLPPCVELPEYVAEMVRVPVPLAPLYVTWHVLVVEVDGTSVHGLPVNVPPPETLKLTVPDGDDAVPPAAVSVTVAVHVLLLEVVPPIFGGAQVIAVDVERRRM